MRTWIFFFFLVSAFIWLCVRSRKFKTLCHVPALFNEIWCVCLRQTKRLGENTFSSYAFLIRRKNCTAITCSNPGPKPPKRKPPTYVYDKSLRGSSFLAKRFSNEEINTTLRNKRSESTNQQIRCIASRWVNFANDFNKRRKKLAIIPHSPSTEDVLEFLNFIAMSGTCSHGTVKSYSYQLNQWLIEVNAKDQHYQSPMRRSRDIQNFLRGLRTRQRRSVRRETVRALPPPLVRSLFYCCENWMNLFDKSLTLEEKKEFCSNSDRVLRLRDLFACTLNCWLGLRPSAFLMLENIDIKCLTGSVLSINASIDKVKDSANEVFSQTTYLVPSNSSDSIHARLKQMAKTWTIVKAASDALTRTQLKCKEKTTGYFFIPLIAREECHVKKNQRCNVVTKMLRNALKYSTISHERTLLKDVFQNVDESWKFTGYSLRKAVASNMYLCGIPIQDIEAHIGWSKKSKTCQVSYIDRSINAPRNRAICAELYADLKMQYANAHLIHPVEDDEDEINAWKKSFFSNSYRS